MNLELVLRYGIQLAMIIPGAFMSILPVYKTLRVKKRLFFILLPTALLSVIICGSVICSMFNIHYLMFLLPCLILFFFGYNFCFGLSVYKKMYCFATASLLTSFATTYTTFLTAPMELTNTENVIYFFSGTVAFGLAAIFCAAFYHLLSKKLPELLNNSDINNTWKWLMFIPIIFNVGIIWSNPISAQNVMTGRMRMVSLILFIVVPLSALLLNYIFWWIASKITESAKLQQSYNLLQMEEKQYRKTMRYLAETRNMRHDFRHHLHVIEELARNGETDKLLEYITQFSETVSEQPKHYCGNNAVNAIAAHYNNMAEKRNIKVYWRLSLEEQIPIKEADLCAVLGNLVENAINAVSCLPDIDKSIQAAVGTIADKTVVVSVKNPYSGDIPIDREGLPVTSKAEHGIGLRSVSNIVEKYNGTLVINTENRVFNVSILMYRDD